MPGNDVSMSMLRKCQVKPKFHLNQEINAVDLKKYTKKHAAKHEQWNGPHSGGVRGIPDAQLCRVQRGEGKKNFSSL